MKKYSTPGFADATLLDTLSPESAPQNPLWGWMAAEPGCMPVFWRGARMRSPSTS
jgi:hypothetical protein